MSPDTVKTITAFICKTLKVWILIAAAVLSTILCMRLVVGKQSTFWRTAQTPAALTGYNREGIMNFVLGNLLSQGEF